MKFYKNLSEIKAENLLIGFFALLITPFLLLFFFNHPSADDFGLAMNTKIFGFGEAQYIYYKNWTGKFFSHAVLSYNPLYFNSMEGYRIAGLLLMIIFFYVLFKLIKHVTGNSVKFREIFLFSLAIFFLYLYAMPSISQSFYWLTASIVYQLGIILIMTFLILYIRLNNTSNFTAKIVYTIISSIILIAIAGCSEIAMALTLMIISLLFIVSLYKKRKLNWYLIIFIILIGIASYIVITAPGNKVREEMFPAKHQFFFSIYFSFTLLIQKIFSWIFLSPILPITLLIMPLIFKIYKNREKISVNFSINPLYSLFTFFVFLFVIMFIPIWSIGKDPYSRTLNVIYFVFLIGWFYNVIVLIFYLNKKYNFSIEKIPRYLYAVAIIIIAIFLVKKNNVRMASADLLRGTAYKYNRELNERYSFIQQSNSDSLVVTEIKNIPRTLFVYDIASDANSLVNQMYAYYFNKKSIIVIDSIQNPK